MAKQEVSTFMAAEEAADAEHLARTQHGVSLQVIIRTLARKWQAGEVTITQEDIEKYEGRRAVVSGARSGLPTRPRT